MTQLHSRSHMPTEEPYLSQWCKLDTMHQAALKNLDDVKSLVAACYLADRKYEVFLAWQRLVDIPRLIFQLTSGDE